ncbi:Hemolysin, contains CBS domains [Hydrocarboniphaga daqingensis]|uniref:Hemolysin, contains CBS domains n=1 Tax=Hydrocarboniphaga daqingensis TaxID=490188 RepID=A0A1M5K2E0_9GAMM|nr:hemolysin family protein [Hydrocarboniphaga daqingensis]SHG46904.1 Hemolysin, contains CBS domains [Hydrocarboniphaga daqingensis]
MVLLQDSLLLLVAFLLVLLNGFFVAAEFAIVKLRHSRVEDLAEGHGWRGVMLGRVHSKLDAYLSACQLGITLASLGLGWIGEPAFAGLLEAPLQMMGIDRPEVIHSIAFVVAFAVISYLHIVLGELAPKSLALRRPETLSLWTAGPLYVFYWLMYPAIWFLNTSSNSLLRRLGLSASATGHQSDAYYSPEELQAILHHSRRVTEGPEIEIKTIVAHTLELADLEAGDLMRPFRELITLSSDDSYAEIRRTIQNHRFSRYVLLEPESETVLGLLHVKDILLEPGGEDVQSRLRRHIREVLEVRENESALELMRRFRSGAPHLALVRDDDERLVGFVTMEDILETIFGEITDEHEVGRQKSTDRRFVWLPDGSFIVPGDTPVYRIERELGRDIEEAEEEDVSTVGGLIMSKLDRVPVEGDLARFEEFAALVRRVQGNRVLLVKITPTVSTK